MTTRLTREPSAIEIEYPESDGEPMGETDTHINVLVELLLVLKEWFSGDPSVYVAGDNMLYYVEGNPKVCVSPDVYVVKGVGNGLRRVYKVWEEGKGPDVVIEVSSNKTKREDVNRKKDLYDETLGVGEYYVFDPTGDYLKDRLCGWVRGPKGFMPAPIRAGRVFSPLLGLELVVQGENLRLINPATGAPLENFPERCTRQRRTEESLRQAEDWAATERAARLEAERSLAEARAQIVRLQQRDPKGASDEREGGRSCVESHT